MPYYGIWARRGASSIFGPAEAWNKDLDGEFMVFDNEKETQSVADTINQSISPLSAVHYAAREMEPGLAEAVLALGPLHAAE